MRSTVTGTVTRAKGLGELSAETAKASMFSPQYQRMDTLSYSKQGMDLLVQLMGDEPELRREYIMHNIDFSTIKE